MNGRQLQFLQGVYRFKPDGSGFEFLTGSTNNTWGLGFSETFDVFGSTANNEPSFYLAIPNRYFEDVPGLGKGMRGSGGPGYQSVAQFYAVHYVTPYIRQVDVHGGYTSAAGHHLYTARSFPQAYWNRIAFITEPTAHIVGQGIVEKQGAGFVTRDGWNLLAGAEEWVAPVHAQVGPDGAVWVADWYNFISQHNPTPPGFSNGPGNAYETSMRDRQRGRIYRVIYRDAAPSAAMSLSKNDPAGLLRALASDNMLWRLHAQRLLVERGEKDVVPELIALARNTSVDAIGTNGAALHALWTLHGLGQTASPMSEAGRTAIAALRHPAAGVRKAAAMVLPRSPESAAAILDAGLLQDPDLHTRLAVILTLAEMPASPEIGKALYTASLDAVNYGDRWLGRALHIAAHRHRDVFLTRVSSGSSGRFRPANSRSRFASARTCRTGARRTRPRWRRTGSRWRCPAAGNHAAWRTSTASSGSHGPWSGRRQVLARTLALGRVGNAAQVWVNGQPLARPPAAPGGWRAPVVFTLPDGVLKAGVNTITVRIGNVRREGGFLDSPAGMYIEGGEKLPLAGTWQYRVERQTNAAALYGRPGELAAHVAAAAAPESGERGLTVAEPTPAAPADVALKLGVIPHQLKFDKTELTVKAGQFVELVFANADVMQHNFLLGTPGSLDRIGAAADAMMTGPDGPAQQYVPAISEVLFATALVDPGQTLTVQFKAPEQPGEYPLRLYVPWSLARDERHHARDAVGRSYGERRTELATPR